ncbi:MAG TPA: hypothetical protein VI432_00850 [Candidatus Paceibacterota bacterium]
MKRNISIIIIIAAFLLGLAYFVFTRRSLDNILLVPPELLNPSTTDEPPLIGGKEDGAKGQTEPDPPPEDQK